MNPHADTEHPDIEPTCASNGQGHAGHAPDHLMQRPFGRGADSHGDAEAGSSARMLEAVQLVHSAVLGLGEDVRRLVAREEVLEHVHRRLVKYEQHEDVERFLIPMTRALAPIIRRLQDQESAMRSQIQRASSRHRRATLRWMAGNLEGLRVDLENALGVFGVERFSCASTQFDRRCQEIAARVQTSEPDRAGMIARRMAPGYRAGDRILMPERVAVYTYSSSSLNAGLESTNRPVTTHSTQEALSP